jgi:hypothetical protein
MHEKPFVRFKPGSSHVGFVVDKVALGQVFSEYFGFPVNRHSTSSGRSAKSPTPLLKKTPRQLIFSSGHHPNAS